MKPTDKENILNKDEKPESWNSDENNTPVNVVQSQNPHKQLSKQALLMKRKQVNDYYNQFIDGNPTAMKGVNLETDPNANFMNNLRNNNNSQDKKTDKDPQEWSPPPKKPETRMKKKDSKNVKKAWGNDNNNNNNKDNNNVNYSNISKLQNAKNDKKEDPNRNYEKPWMVGVKKEEQKDKPTTFLEFCSQNGRPVDEHLINTLESEVIDTDLNVKFDDIAGNEDAKEAIEEACI